MGFRGRGWLASGDRGAANAAGELGGVGVRFG